MKKSNLAALLAAPLVALAAPPGPAATPRPAEAVITESQLRPVFAAGPLSRARADFAAGHWLAAASGFERSKAPEARYLRAIALVEARRGDDAVKALARVEKELPALADRVSYWRGRAQQVAGDGRAAAASFAEVPERSILWADAQLSRARALYGAGDRDGALASLAPILSLPPPPDETQRGDPSSDALLLAGRIRAASGSASELPWARRAFLECWSAHPLAPAASSCIEELKKLPAPADAEPAPEDRLRHAEALLDANRNAPALSDLEQLAPALSAPGPGEALACRAGYAHGRALRRMRQHTRAIEILRPVVDRCDDPQLRVKAIYMLASAASIVDAPQGVVWYRALAHDYPAHPFADDALFYAADLLARAGQTEEALAALADLAENHPQGDFRAEALFRTAWIQKQAGFIAGALASLSRIERDYERTDPYEYARAAYWRARLLFQRAGEGDAARAQETWRALADRYPADYYGLLARARLEEHRGSVPAWKRPQTAEEPAAVRYHVGGLAEDAHFKAGLLLLRLGLDRAASEELVAIDRKLLANPDALLLVAQLLDRAGDHKTSTRLVRSVGRAALREKPEGPALRIWRVAYPPAFRREVDRYAPSAGVPPELLLALMREESGLDPGAVSAAGAVGLTQLMLPTAQGVAKKLKLRKVKQSDLMNPETSIRLGATYFGGLLRRYGSEALALAAYNAGDTPVRRWLQQRGTLPLDEFVEEIPIQETRGYVKRVLRSYGAYRYLYGTPTARPLLVGQALPSSQ